MKNKKFKMIWNFGLAAGWIISLALSVFLFLLLAAGIKAMIQYLF